MKSSLKISKKLHGVHKIRAAQAGVSIEDATEEAIRSHWRHFNRKSKADRRER